VPSIAWIGLLASAAIGLIVVVFVIRALFAMVTAQRELRGGSRYKDVVELGAGVAQAKRSAAQTRAPAASRAPGDARGERVAEPASEQKALLDAIKELEAKSRRTGRKD